MRALDAITAQPWAITQEWLATIMAVAAREVGDLEAVEARLGRPLQNTRTVTQRGAAAVIPVIGPIFRRANLFTRLSGATSIEILAKDFTAALENPAVQAIVLDLDSPGGEVAGVNEFAQMVADARAQKPVIAYVGSMAASAAYWIASAASEIVVDATAMLGSIGVVMALPSDRPVGEIEFTSSQSPNKRVDVGSSAGRRQVQDLVDATAAVFVEAVARNRGTTPARVLADFGAGGLLVGREAVAAGMADRLGSLESILAAYQLPAPARGRPAATDPRTATPPPRTGPAARIVQETPMTAADDLERRAEEAPPAPAPTPPPPAASAAPPAPPTLTSDPAIAAQLAAFGADQRQWFLEQMEAVRRQAQAEARQLFEQQQAEQARERAILAFAQHVTTPTTTRAHALPFKAEQVAEALRGLNDAQRARVEALLSGVVESGLVAFDRLGSAGEGAEERDPRAAYDAAVLAKVERGMSRLDAIRAVNREQPALYQAMQTEKGGR